MAATNSGMARHRNLVETSNLKEMQQLEGQRLMKRFDLYPPVTLTHVRVPRRAQLLHGVTVY